MLRMRARGVGDLRLLRAMERAPRVAVHAAALRRYRGARHRAADRLRPDRAAALDRRRDDRGAGRRSRIAACSRSATGSGYAAGAARATGGRGAVARALPDARRRSRGAASAFGLTNVARRLRRWARLRRPARRGIDRILVHALIEPPAERLTAPLAPGGALVAAMADEAAGGAAHRSAGARCGRAISWRARRACAHVHAAGAGTGAGALSQRRRRRPLKHYFAGQHQRFILNLTLTQSGQSKRLCVGLRWGVEADE